MFVECSVELDLMYICMCMCAKIIKKNGKSRGFAFVTMSSPEEAQAVVEKFDSQVIFYLHHLYFCI